MGNYTQTMSWIDRRTSEGKSRVLRGSKVCSQAFVRGGQPAKVHIDRPAVHVHPRPSAVWSPRVLRVTRRSQIYRRSPVRRSFLRPITDAPILTREIRR